MKKKILLLGVLFASSTAVFSQTTVAKGDIIIDPYVGVMQSNMLRSEPTDENGVTNWKLNGGQLAYGGRFEYMLADKFGLGVDVNFVKSGSQYDYAGTDSLGNTTTYSWDYTAKKLRAMIRMNYHFVQNERVDAYLGTGVGYKHTTRVWTISDPSNQNDLSQEKALIPVAFRLAIGTRVYFTQNIGAMIELGLGGGTPLQFGLSVKI
tara:strand:+ start:222 stop:842 length:621 start_codon:yes stop_codon:yes gene_type:complete